MENNATTQEVEKASQFAEQAPAVVKEQAQSTSNVQAKSEIDPSQIVDKMIPHVEKSVSKAVEAQAQKQESQRMAREQSLDMINNFNATFEEYKKNNPEKAERIIKESHDGGKLTNLTLYEIPELFNSIMAPEILNDFLDSPDDLERFNNITDGMGRRDVIIEKKGELKAKKQSGTKKQFSNAPEPIEKIKESGGTGAVSLKDLEKADFDTYLKYRENELLKEQGFTK